MRNARKVTRRRSVNAALPAALFALLIAVVAAGCGSSSSDTSSSSSGGGKLDVVGYSTPESVYAGSPRAGLRKDLRRARASASATPSAPPATRAARSSPASRPRSSTSPRPATWNGWSKKANSSPRTGNKQPYGGIATDSVVVILVRKGNPKGIKSFDDLLTKDVDIVTPNPFSSGSARWNIMAVYGTAIEEGKSPDQALEAVKTVLEKTVAQPGSGRDALRGLHPGRGRRAAHLRERGDQGRKGRRRRRIRHPAVDDPDRNPDRGHQRSARAGGAKTSSTSSGPTKARNSGPKTATARSTRSWSTRSSSRPRRTCSRSASSAAGARSTTNSSTKKPARSPRSRANSESPPPADHGGAPGNATSVPAPRGGQSACPGSAPASAAGTVVLYLSADRPAAAGGADRANRSSGGLGHFWDQVTSPQAVSSLEADA